MKLDWPDVSHLKNFENFFFLSFFMNKVFFFRVKVLVVVCFRVNFFCLRLFLFKYVLTFHFAAN